MAKIRLTKNELKSQKDALKRYTRFLPTLELKKKQLLMEVRKIQNKMDGVRRAIEEMNTEVGRWAGVFAQDVNLPSLIKPMELKRGSGNIAGIDIPVFQELEFEDPEYDFMETPLWVDAGIEAVKEQMSRYAELTVLEEQLEILQKELRITIQRIKLFEEVKIPEARENIRVIRIFLADQQTAEVVRGKIAKAKIARKKKSQSAI